MHHFGAPRTFATSIQASDCGVGGANATDLATYFYSAANGCGLNWTAIILVKWKEFGRGKPKGGGRSAGGVKGAREAGGVSRERVPKQGQGAAVRLEDDPAASWEPVHHIHDPG